MQLFVPLGKGHINVAANVVAFYVVAAPVVAAIALTDAVTTDVATKMGACVGLSSIAQVCASSHDRTLTAHGFRLPHSTPCLGAPRRLRRVLLLPRRLDDAGQDHPAARQLGPRRQPREFGSIDGAHEPGGRAPGSRRQRRAAAGGGCGPRRR